MDQLEAGIELDTQVAERVMGFIRFDRPGLPSYWEPPGGRWTTVTFPPYSTDIAAAWRVVEAMRGKGFRWRIDSTPDCWCVVLWEGEAITVATTPTVPLAICRAALKAMEEQQ